MSDDSETLPPEIVNIIRVWHVQEDILAAGYSAYIYSFLTTFDDEVSEIWSQSWKSGKILFMIIRYSPFVDFAFNSTLGYPAGYDISLKTCRAFQWIVEASSFIRTNATEAALLLCLYALLGTKRRYFVIFFAFFVSYTVVTLSLMIKSIMITESVPLFDFEKELRYACAFGPIDDFKYMSSVYNYVVLSRTAITAALSIATLAIRYRRQEGSLINVIRQDGGVYYIGTILIRLANSIILSPKISTEVVQYGIVNTLYRCAVPILVAHLLINVKKIGTRGGHETTRVGEIVSTLMFDAPKITGVETEDQGGDDTAGDSVVVEDVAESKIGEKDGKPGQV
ncbi:hypothetical protein DFP72DRAFT_938179 [Ephemerocybe angulata]|uniref:DUF6533 domain-containing protein n=1 Tax=Ephemerocybe angulata TaxID=980116 RepID=A0A8H6H8P5_9AGAR|nr:hypothetical protein DFP72DRAFT_938179 [Tulosesus angulatus]